MLADQILDADLLQIAQIDIRPVEEVRLRVFEIGWCEPSLTPQRQRPTTYTCSSSMMGTGTLSPIQCNWWLDERGRNTIREKIEREPTGKIVIMQPLGREVIAGGEGYQVREGPALYNAVFGAEKEEIGPENTYLWNVKP